MKEHRKGTVMLKTILKYHGWSEAVQVKNITGAISESALRSAIDIKRNASYVIISFISNQITRKSLLALSRKLNLWVVQIAEEFTATTNWKNDRPNEYVVITTPWTTMLGALISVLTDANMANLTIVYDEEYESLAKQLPIELRRNAPVQLIMLGSLFKRRGSNTFCLRVTFASNIVIMTNTEAAEQFLGEITNCASILEKFVFTKDCTSSSNLTTYADVLWIRPHFVKIPTCIDAVISWTVAGRLQNGLFIIGKELEIAFYDDIARLVVSLTEAPARSDSISEAVYSCLVKKPTMDSFCNESKRAPFVYRRDFENGTWLYYGYCIDILETLSRNLNFTYEIYEVEDGEYGRKNAIGRMNGLAAELFNGDANIALASFVPTAEREALVDFSCPFHEVTGLAVLLKDHARESALILLTIATWRVWLAVIAAASIAALLSFRNVAKPITQLEQLFQQNGIKYSVVADSSAGYYFSRLAELEDLMDLQWRTSMIKSSFDLESKVMLGYWDYPFQISYRQLWKLMRDVGMPTTIDEAVSRVLASPSPTHGFAFIATEPTVEFLEMSDCNLRMVKSKLFARHYAIGVQQGSELGPLVSKQILLLKADGFMGQLKKKWWNESGKGSCEYVEPKSEEVDMYDLVPVFSVLVTEGKKEHDVWIHQIQVIAQYQAQDALETEFMVPHANETLSQKAVSNTAVKSTALVLISFVLNSTAQMALRSYAQRKNICMIQLNFECKETQNHLQDDADDQFLLIQPPWITMANFLSSLTEEMDQSDIVILYDEAHWFLTDTLWIRPSPRRSIKKLDAFIEWSDKMKISKTVVDIGLELEIAFHWDLVSTALFLHSFPVHSRSMRRMAISCMNGTTKSGNMTYAEELCNQKPFFGSYRLLQSGTLKQDILLRIYRVIGTEQNMDMFLVANWTLENGITQFYDFGLSSAIKFARHYRIAAVEEAPFVEKYTLFSDSKPRYQGYCIDLLQLIATALNFTYEIYILPESSFGYVNAIGRVDGLVSELHNGNAHIALAPIETSFDRELFVDFTYPLNEARGMAVLIKQQQQIEPPKTLLTIVDWSVWLCLLIALCVTSSGRLPRNMSGRIIVTAWWLFTFSIIASYTANLAARLKYLDPQSELETLDQLLRQTKILYSAVSGTAEARYFQRLYEIETEFYRRWSKTVESPSLTPSERVDKSFWDYPFQLKYASVWRFMNEVGMLRSYKEGIERVLQSDRHNRSFALIGKQQIGWLKILQLMQTQELKRLEEKWWAKKATVENCEPINDDIESVSMEEIYGFNIGGGKGIM
ncbi:Lig chan and Lig chan-Glu bd domain containing pr otein [Trichuris trichiura]|uniref:Lig chan and Lig chan-Glu bd domain containing pr otein n=1 Tax=Trichuris trichiura TaxID=36087 RepID=A0A077Z3Y6_TRITR|nr:Lig chan and Lig chan-Glu bd domain containing pr otein [Trichuris trichiura]